jgi:hypothetical protein
MTNYALLNVLINISNLYKKLKLSLRSNEKSQNSENIKRHTQIVVSTLGETS